MAPPILDRELTKGSAEACPNYCHLMEDQRNGMAMTIGQLIENESPARDDLRFNVASALLRCFTRLEKPRLDSA